MTIGRDIICISSIDWDFLWQGHQEIMSTLAGNGNRVLFIENTGVRMPTVKDMPRLWKRFLNWRKGYKGIRKEREDLYIYSPLALPFPYSGMARKINRMIMLSVIKRWMRAMEFQAPIIWSFLPTGIALDLIDELDPLIFIYYCIDDFASSSPGAKKIIKAEEKIIRRADLVFATSLNLREKCAAINKETYLFPFGINIDNYNKTRDSNIDVPEEMRDIKRPIIGYVGGLHKWIDFGLLKKIASTRKDVSLVLIGPKQTELDEIERIDNVFILGEKKGHRLPDYVKFFDAGIIPYKKTDYTRNVYPTKINEYLAMGKPVISTDIPEVVNFNNENGGGFIYLIRSEDDIAGAVNRALSEKKDGAVIEKRISVANANSWAGRIEKMCGIVEKKIGVLQSRISDGWLGNFKRFYRKAHARTLRIIVSIAVLYTVLFYTPFIWFAASPLKISQAPQQSDAIVVFGGGVGETGSPGESTIERARMSVELYKEGYAGRIIYSSGYTYKFNDAENMKLVALSMGVSKENIILEKQANSTYENVKYTIDILRKLGLKNIILISSPYNMRRVSLVYRHIGGDINVVYVPVSNPQFYFRTGIVRLEQIKSILHEYLGILYYAIKGYI